MRRRFASINKLFLVTLLLSMVSAFAAAQYNSYDQGQYQILSARYGTDRNNVDVTARLRDLARQDLTFRMGNSTFGVDPAPGVVKTLRIFARGRNGQTRMFEYREGSTVDGSMFADWRRGGWGNERWNGGWNGASGGDEGMYRILQARYGTPRNNVDVTQRLKELARQDVRFRMGNSTFGIDPDPGVVKILRIFARGPRGETRTFEYREGSVVDGSQFTGWGRGDWGNERWNGGWGGRDGDHDRDDRYGRNDDRDHGRDNYGRDNYGRGPEMSLNIVSATYGAGRMRADVTSRVQSMIREGRLDLYVNNLSMGGDPAPNYRKTLTITYTAGRGDRRQEASISEGGRISIP